MIKPYVGVLFLALAMASTAGPSGSTEQPYDIYAIESLSGQFGFLGQEGVQGLRIIEKMTNAAGGIDGRPIHFVILDDQSNPVIAVQDADAIIAKRPAFFIGPTGVSLCAAVAPIVARRGPVMYCTSPGIHPSAGSYVFSSGISSVDTLQGTKKFIQNRGWTKVGFITSTDATGQDADSNIKQVFGTEGPIAVVAHEHFNTSDLSVSAQMADIKASGAQVLIVWTTGTPFGTVLRGVHDAALNIPVVTTPGNLSDAEMHAFASFMPKALYFPGTPAFAPDVVPPGPLKDALDHYFAALIAGGAKPENAISLTWDPTFLLIGALRKLGLTATAPQIRTYLASLQGDVGIYGTHDFPTIPQRGLSENSVVIIRWEPSTKTWVGVSGLGVSPLHN